MATITVIVPVYNGAADLERCLASLARNPPPGGEVVLYDDASTDSRVVPLLEGFAAAMPGCRLLRAEANSGFILACNAAAAAAAPGNDLLFLNTDTELTRGAIEEMAAVLARTGAAVCCPMSSNATFLSLPRYQQPNELPEGWSAEDMARHVRAAAGEGFGAPIPTPVGFCMLVTRAAWRTWGPFDAAYGTGYGEEDEFGQRAQAGGARLVAALRAYVWHRGGASFGAPEATREKRRVNGELLLARWPGYAASVSAFARANPFRPMLERLWDALLSAPERRPRHVLHLVPQWELQGPLRDRVLGIARAARGLANHTVVVPTPDRGAWLDAIDFETEPGVRVVGLVDLPERFGRFLAASVATHVHVHGQGPWNAAALGEAARAHGRALLLASAAEPSVEQCLAWYRA